jgi:glucokinase
MSGPQGKPPVGRAAGAAVSVTLTSARPAGPVLALDLGGTNARAAVVTPDGTLASRRSGPTPMADGASAVVDYCAGLMEAALTEHRSAGGAAPIAIGICAPGPLDARTGTLIDPPNLRDEWWGFPLAPTLSERFGVPAVLEKDTNVSILGEAVFGAGRGAADLVYLTISTGIGGAVLSGGRLLTGPDGVAGELGHLTVDMDGPLCGCGARGHLEAIASGTGIANAARLALEAGEPATTLRRVAGEVAPRPLSAADVARAADLGDAVAGVIIERARRAVAVSVVSIVDVFGPDAVILGGGISIAWGERLVGPAREAVAATAFAIQAARAKIVPAALGDDVGLVGTVPLVASALPALTDA